MSDVKRYRMPWLDDPLSWPRDLRKSGTEIVLASDYDALAKRYEMFADIPEGTALVKRTDYDALAAELEAVKSRAALRNADLAAELTEANAALSEAHALMAESQMGDADIQLAYEQRSKYWERAQALEAELAGVKQQLALAPTYAKMIAHHGVQEQRIATLEALLRQARAWIEEDTTAMRECHMPYNDTDPIDQEVRAEVDAQLAWLRDTSEAAAPPASAAQGWQPLSDEDRAVVEQYLADMTCPECHVNKAYHRPGCSKAEPPATTAWDCNCGERSCPYCGPRLFGGVLGTEGKL